MGAHAIRELSLRWYPSAGYGLCSPDDGLWTYAEGIGPGSDIRAGHSTVDGDITVINMSVVGIESLATHRIRGVE